MNIRCALASLLLLAPAATASTEEAGVLFERVVDRLESEFYDRDFRERRLPRLARRFRPLARAAASLEEERQVVHDLLAGIPTSHLALFSRSSYDAMNRELAGEAVPCLGFQAVVLDGRTFADWVLEGGPAARAGLRRGDEILALDGLRPERSPRLDWRSDDAALPDPPLHRILCREGELVEVRLCRAPGQVARAAIRAGRYGGVEAARASVSLIESEGRRVGYVHLWYVQEREPSRLLARALAGELREAEALVLDLRGRGGMASEVERILRLFGPRDGAWSRPLVLLIDSRTRSAKEVLAHELRSRARAFLVGERTAGAVIPATFRDVGQESVLMFPAFTLGAHTKALEGRGVEPDLEVPDAIPYAAGRDPILEAGLLSASAWCRELTRDR